MAYPLSMMLRRVVPAPGLLLTRLLLLLVLTGMQHAQARMPVQADHFQPRSIRVADRAISMRDAINRVRQQTGGRVLDAQDAGDHYRVKVLTPQGVVRVFQVDASTGAIR